MSTPLKNEEALTCHVTRRPTRIEAPLFSGSALPCPETVGVGAVSKQPGDLWQARSSSAYLPVCAQAQPQKYPYPVVKVKVTSAFQACSAGELSPASPARRVTAGPQRPCRVRFTSLRASLGLSQRRVAQRGASRQQGPRVGRKQIPRRAAGKGKGADSGSGRSGVSGRHRSREGGRHREALADTGSARQRRTYLGQRGSGRHGRTVPTPPPADVQRRHRPARQPTASRPRDTPPAPPMAGTRRRHFRRNHARPAPPVPARPSASRKCMERMFF
ncbi:serine/arginine repetitive matrix protein 1-like [Pipra filicauda]|uniref:Serine/arginine repetitive matrix protein 1-like n=1 Tax=Pipra filicauda TaxID=649802 RepID=A0A7R5KQ40_9PASS|nr:serine/arginine repetitive matrix protein 1-like [Pipra filicauda]